MKRFLLRVRPRYQSTRGFSVGVCLRVLPVSTDLTNLNGLEIYYSNLLEVIS